MKQSRSFTEHANALADWDRSILRNRQVLLDVEEHLCQVSEPILCLVLLHSDLAGLSFMAEICECRSCAAYGEVWLSLAHAHRRSIQGPHIDRVAAKRVMFDLYADTLRSGSSGKESRHARNTPERDPRSSAVY